jgi:signal transduction histidine kinase/ActR/RegA family two-component response regulator
MPLPSSGENASIDRKYLAEGTGEPFARVFRAGTVCPGQTAPIQGLAGGPGALKMKLTANLTTANLRLRTKLVLSFVLVIATLSCATLMAVGHVAKKHLQQEIVAETQTSVLTFLAMLHEHQNALNRKADLLATLADLTYFDSNTFQESTDNPLETDGSDLVVLADANHQIMTLHTTNPKFTPAIAQGLLLRSLTEKNTKDWWYAGGSLYQVAIEPVHRRPNADNSQLGTVVVGRELDYTAVHNLDRSHAAEIAFLYGGTVVASTMGPFDEGDLGRQAPQVQSDGQVQLGDQRFYAISVGLTDGDGPAARMIALKSYTRSEAFLAEMNHLLAALGLLALGIGAYLALLIADTFTRPLGNLDRGVQALERGDYAFPLEARGGDEIAHVTRAFDQMRGTLQRNEAQKRQLEEDLRQSQKMEALGRLAGGVAHDFNNLLTVIKGHSELITERLPEKDPLQGSGQQIKKAADRAASLTRQMLAFSRRQALEPTVFDMNTLVADMYKLLKRLIHEDIEFTFRAGESLGRIKADTGQIEQVLLNLAVNASDAMPRGGKLTIETKNVAIDPYTAKLRPTVEPGCYVMLGVTDTGVGMNEETMARIFEPFFTTKAAGKGTGLGLATVYGVVKQSGGFIWVDSTPGQGSRFEVYLPRVEQDITPNPAETLEPVRARAVGTVLLAEDEEAVRMLAFEFLTAAGYRVYVAPDGERALEIADSLSEPIHVLVTDVVMPKMRGPELAKRLQAKRPDLKVVFMSGYLEQHDGGEEFAGSASFLQKPFSKDVLVRQISAALTTETSQAPALHIA